MDWLHLFTAALSGGSIVKVFDFLYSEFRQESTKIPPKQLSLVTLIRSLNQQINYWDI
jgi:hypothetical protein